MAAELTKGPAQTGPHEVLLPAHDATWAGRFLARSLDACLRGLGFAKDAVDLAFRNEFFPEADDGLYATFAGHPVGPRPVVAA